MSAASAHRPSRRVGDDGDELLREFEKTLREAVEELEGFRARFLTALGEPRPRGEGATSATPPDADVEDLESHFQVEVDLPGVPRERIDVKIIGQSLVVHADQPLRKGAAERHYVLRERPRGIFHREVAFPEPVVGSQVEARFENGVLTVKVPKARPPVEHRVLIS